LRLKDLICSITGTMNSTFSITRALAELKLLDKRITKHIEEAYFVRAVSKKDRTFDEKEFERSSQSQLQSIFDLIQRRNKIKRAIILSNSVTSVTINSERMTVAEAIDLKQSLPMRKALLVKIKQCREQAKTMVDTSNSRMESDLQNLLVASFGKSAQTNSNDVENISKPFREANQSRLLDPINCSSVISKLEKDIEEYEREADFTLSESNALTMITV